MVEACRARLIDRRGEFFGYCDVLVTSLEPVVSQQLPEVVILNGWPGRAFVRDRKSDIETDTSYVPSYREQSFGRGENFQLRSGA